MLLTKNQVTLIRQSWRTIRNVSPVIVGDLFYSKLFIDHPSLRKLFPKQMEEQYRKLTDMLNALIMRLDNVDSITEEITAMAQRHQGYGVKPAHYKSVGEALLWTLEKGLGDDWSPAMREAWHSYYTQLADTMMKLPSANVH